MTIAAAASLKLKRLPCIFKSSSSLLFNIDNDNSSCQRLPISELNVENRNIEEVSIGKMIEKHDQQHILHLIRDFFVVYLVGILYVLKELVTPHRKLSKTDVRDKAGQTAIVTGGTRGIGLEIVRQLLAHGMHVIMASSNSVVGKESLRQLRVEFPNEKVEFHPLDLKSLASVKEFANHFLQRNIPLHLLINNAGVMFGPYSLTKDGFESQLGINYIGHFYLTYLLLPVLEKTGTSTEKTRIVNVSSCGHFTGRIKISDLNSSESYSTYGCYGQSKLAQIMQAKLFQEYFQKKNINITINAVHPGVVDTKLYQNTWFEFAPFITRSFFKIRADIRSYSRKVLRAIQMEEFDKENKNRQAINLLQQEIDENRKQLHCLEVERSQMKIKLQQYEKEWQMSKSELIQEKADLKQAQKNYAKLCKSKGALSKKITAKDQARQKLKSELQQLHYNLCRMHNNMKILQAQIIEKENELEHIDDDNPINEIKQAMNDIGFEIARAYEEVVNAKSKVDPTAIETPIIPTYAVIQQKLPLEKEILELCEKLRLYLQQLGTENSRTVPPCDSLTVPPCDSITVPPCESIIVPPCDGMIEQASCVVVQEKVPPCEKDDVGEDEKSPRSVEDYLDAKYDLSIEKVPVCSSEKILPEDNTCIKKTEAFVQTMRTTQEEKIPCKPSRDAVNLKDICETQPLRSIEKTCTTFKKCHASEYHVHSGYACQSCTRACHSHSECHHVHPYPVYSRGSISSGEYFSSDPYQSSSNQISQSKIRKTELFVPSNLKPDSNSSCRNKNELPKEKVSNPLAQTQAKIRNEWNSVLGQELQTNSRSYPSVSADRYQPSNGIRAQITQEKSKNKVTKENIKRNSMATEFNSNDLEAISHTAKTDVETSQETQVLIGKSRESKEDDTEI